MQPLLDMNDVAALLPKELFARFCDAIAYSKEDRAPNPVERRLLGDVLREVARIAHGSGITAERMLIELKTGWTRVCKRDASPDLHDGEWTKVVTLVLDEYERARLEVRNAPST